MTTNNSARPFLFFTARVARGRSWTALALLAMVGWLAGCGWFGASPQKEPAPLDANYTAWNTLLVRHVTDTGVDYQAIAADRSLLDKALADLKTVRPETFEGWTRPAQLAFLINAHNAFAIDRVVSHWPVDNLSQTRLVGSARGERSIALLGRRWSLRELADQAMSQDYLQSRAIFLLNWAERGCAPLAPTAVTEANLPDLMERQTRRTLTDKNYCDYDRVQTTVRLTPLVKWYRQDFVRDYTTLWSFIGRYLPSAQTKMFEHRPPRIRYLPFDHELNGIVTTAPSKS